MAMVDRQPTERPAFTVGQLKKAIPAHCFERSMVRSLSYLIWDLAIAGLLLWTTRFYDDGGVYTKWALWAAYMCAQACVLTAVWVIAHECAHECGHHAFSDYAWVDDTVGMVMHTCLLVPYFSWKYSHRRHHSNTASLDNDEAFVPKEKESLKSALKITQNPVGRMLTILIGLTMGWPLYLAFNVSGRKYPRFACHFDPYGPIYNVRQRAQIFVSDAGLSAFSYGLYRLCLAYGAWKIAAVYGVPLLIVNAFLVIITYLQHTHPSLPHYDESEWEWLRGACATVDRDYGVLNGIFHHITDTHVAHHLFSTIPHYHAKEATEAVKPVLGPYYTFDPTPFWKAVWRELRECLYVEAEDSQHGVSWYKNKPP